MCRMPSQEQTRKTNRTRPTANACPTYFRVGRIWKNSGLRVIQLIVRLAFVSILREDSNIGVVRNQTIHQISGYTVLVMVFENPHFPLGPTRGQVHSELNLNFTESFFDLLDCREFLRDKHWARIFSVNRERQIAKHPFRVGTLFGLRENTVSVAVDTCNHGRRHSRPPESDAWMPVNGLSPPR